MSLSVLPHLPGSAMANALAAIDAAFGEEAKAERLAKRQARNAKAAELHAASPPRNRSALICEPAPHAIRKD